MKAEASPYSPVTKDVAARLREIVGEKYVVFGDAEALEPFSHDEVPDHRYRHMPETLVRPSSADEIAAVMKLANEANVPVTPRGAGSGLAGGAVPVFGGIVLSLDRMNRILEIDRDNMVVVCEPGVVTSEINERVADFGLFYAGYPMSLETCYVGGNVATNAGGAKAVKYGVTSRYVLGLEVVTPTGGILELGGKLVKDVTGYNLLQLMIGSEGTLGVFTKIILKLIPAPRKSVDLLCLFKSTHDAIATVPRIMTESGITPTAIEFMDREAVLESCQYLNETLPYEQAGAMLLITVDGADTQQVERDYEAIGELCFDHGAIEVYVADNHTTSERIWKVRRNIAEAFAVHSDLQANEDLVVPPAAIANLVDGMGDIAAECGVMMPSYGHAGDGNLHTRITPPSGWSEEKWLQTVPQIQQDLYELTARLGGRLSGEHGIGHKRKGHMVTFLTPATLDAMRAVKRAFDPNNILNPGKVFDL
ncbi:MAG: FAD-binding oxidoreductase [Planctomycetota bacterium]|jgi:glycolate oxidase